MSAVPDELTIDELSARPAYRCATSAPINRAVCCQPPEIRARTGFYGAEHVARLELIKEMQADGFNLRAIERLLAVGDLRARRRSASSAR